MATPGAQLADVGDPRDREGQARDRGLVRLPRRRAARAGDLRNLASTVLYVP